MKPRKCKCGSDGAHIINELKNGEWECYCNSCGRNDAEGYGKTREEAIMDFNKMMDPELNPCPFCGSESKWSRGGFGELQPYCTNENCGCQFGGGIWTTEVGQQRLADKWNKRSGIQSKWLKEQLDVRLEYGSKFPTSIRLHRGGFTTIVEVGEHEEA